jgi:hypothetical protein
MITLSTPCLPSRAPRPSPLAPRPSTLVPRLSSLLLLAACGRAVAPAPEWVQEDGYRWHALEVPRGSPGFTRMPEHRTGIRFRNTVGDSALLENRWLAHGAGVALGDVDGDGLVDVFLAATEGCNALYRNLGGWRFEDITEAAGVGACDRYSTGAAFADVNGNGHLDLILVTVTGPNAVFLNDGTGLFTERRDLGLDTTARGSTTVAMADVDGNGWLDLYVANYKPNSPQDQIPPQQRAPNQVVRQVAPGRYEVVPERQDDYKLVMRPDMGGLNLSMRGMADAFYVNEGGHFRAVPPEGGRFLDAADRPVLDPAESFTLSVRFADLTGNGAPDLYVVNDYEDPDLFWVNDGTGRFRLAPWYAQRQTSNSGMGMDVGDLDGDGIPDFFEVDMLAYDSRRLKTQMPTHTALPKRLGDTETQLQLMRNTLHLNRGDGTFAEVAAYAGLEASGWSWSTLLLDVDLDGWLDVLVTTGHLWDVMDADTQERLQHRLTDLDWKRLRWEHPPLPLRNVAWRNRGDLTFEDAGARWSFGTEEDFSYAIAAADLDGDGDLDVVVTRLDAPPLILRNNAAAPRVAVRLVGDAPNTRAVGAKIRLLGGATPVQEREVTVGGIYLAHSDYLASFAAGEATQMTLVVDWRDGRRSVLEDVRPDRLYEITTATATGRTPVDSAGIRQDAPLFEDATSLLGGHVHHESEYDDWARQFLLPHALSRMGPGVAWFDLTGNGHEDLVVGAGRGGRLTVFPNEGGRLGRPLERGPPAAGDFTAVLGLAEPEGRRLLVGISNWEAASPADALAVPAVITDRGDTIVQPQAFSVGPLALGDYTGNGRLDLFVGGRAIPGRYPESAASGLLRNEGGRFVPDADAARLLDGVGLVSAALFADLDGDGHPDLVLARDWGSIAVLLNRGGRFEPAPASWGFERWTGRWNGIAAADLTGDGRLDLVATNWGRNTGRWADESNPLVALHGPIGPGERVEMLLAQHDPRLNALAPLNSFPRVRVGIRDLALRIRSFAEYAEADVDRVLGPFARRVERREVVTLDHMVFLNRGTHFEAVPLPPKAQFAPAFAVVVADFDGDGHEDVFLSQNFFPTAVGQPRHDAGRGLLLRGDGRGGLAPVPGVESGLIAYGDQRGAAAADFDGDGRVDLALAQHAGPTRLFRNRMAEPGLRVRLAGPPGNPTGVGAQIRVVYGERMGPVREVHAGSGYWSQNGAVQVMGLSGTPTAVWVRWPGGAETTTAVPPGAREVVARAEGGALSAER